MSLRGSTSDLTLSHKYEGKKRKDFWKRVYWIKQIESKESRGSKSFFCKKSHRKYFWLCRLSQWFSSALEVREQCRQYVCDWRWLCANQIWLRILKFNFHIIFMLQNCHKKYYCFLFPFQLFKILKTMLSSWEIHKWVTGWIWPVTVIHSILKLPCPLSSTVRTQFEIFFFN